MDLFLAFPEATEPISQTLVTAKMLTTLKGFSMASRPKTPLHSC